MNKCARCKKDKPRSEFNADTRNKSGLQSACKECEKSRIAKSNDKKEAVKPNHTDFKCTKCEITKPVMEFYKNRTNRGHDATCRICRLAEKKRPEAPVRKEIASRKPKALKNPEKYDDFVNSARNSSVLDLSSYRLCKIGDERRFKAGVKRIKKVGLIKNAYVAKHAYRFRDGVWRVDYEIRADGVLFPIKSQNFISKEIAEKHLNHVRENAKQIIEGKLKEAA